MKAKLLIMAALLCGASVTAQTKMESGSTATPSSKQEKASWEEAIADQKAWTVSNVLARRHTAVVDTVMENYAQAVAIPHMQFGDAAAITGNLGSEGKFMNYFQRPQESDFFFNDALYPYLPRVENTPFFNTKVPMTLLSFNTGGGSQTTQDWLKARLSGN
ncbi:MAG: hypothetical protein K2L33_05745, partial [Muribaculaceae bacterium]|nr:hypothetical protein [Muribaculaceae bacterium]